jgi:hypothetical protein
VGLGKFRTWLQYRKLMCGLCLEDTTLQAHKTKFITVSNEEQFNMTLSTKQIWP